jgi:predicted porin
MKTLRFLMLGILLLTAVGFAAGAQAAAPATPALGQPGSLVEVYGLIDTGLRISTNADAAGSTSIGFSQGLFNGSRFGIRGTEDLGSSFKAIYTLEGGVVLPYGMLDQQGQIFGRQAWVGVSSDYGTLTFGRQYGTLSDALGVGDVFGSGHGNIGYNNGKSGNLNNLSGTDAVNSFFFSETGFRWDQSIKYAANFSGLTVGAMAMLGDMTVSYQDNTMISASLGYNAKGFPVQAAVAVQYESDNSTLHHSVVGGGLKYALDATDGIYAFYFHSAFDQGFAAINGNNSEFSSPLSQARTDDIGSLGVNYFALPSLNLMAAYYLDYAQNVLSSGDNGMRNSFLAAVDYYFTKDFDAYVAGWLSLFSNALQNAGKNGGDIGSGNPSPSYSNTLSFMVGARYRF